MGRFERVLDRVAMGIFVVLIGLATVFIGFLVVFVMTHADLLFAHCH